MNETVRRLNEAGTAVWLDDLSRDRLDSGELRRQVEAGLITGVTTNPAILHRAVTTSTAYAGQLAALARLGTAPGDAVRLLACADVRRAADALRPVHDATDGRDGMVSLEVSPDLAHDTAGTLAEARLLHWLVDRPNVMIKIPATDAGLPAVADCLAEGISVNVTLIFGADRYTQVWDAFLGGMERAAAAGRDLGRIASVASVFVSRVDGAVDPLLDEAHTARAAALRGTAALGGGRQTSAPPPSFPPPRPPGLRTPREGPGGPALAGPRGPRRPPAAPAVGVDRREGPRLQRHPLRRRAGGPGHRQHHARRHPGRAAGPRRRQR